MDASVETPSTAPTSSIITELLTDSKVAKLMHEAVVLEPQSQLFRQINTAAGPALQLAMDGATAAAQRGRFLVEFSTEGTAALKSGSVTLLNRVDGRLQPTLVNAASKIEENATLVGRTGQVAASVVAIGHAIILLAVQAQLVSMQRQLDRIEKKLDTLRRFLDEEQVSRVRGWLRKLVALRDEMSSAPWTDMDQQRWLVLLDTADAALLQVDELAKQQCEAASSTIAKTSLTVKWFRSSGDSLLNELLNEVEQYRRYYDLRCLVIVSRLAVAHVKKALGKPTGAPQIRGDVEALAASASAHQEVLVINDQMLLEIIELAASASAHQEVLERRAPEFRTIFRSKDHETKKQRTLVKDASVFLTRSKSILVRLNRDLEMLDFETKRTARVIVEVRDDGKLQPLALLPENSGQVLVGDK